MKKYMYICVIWLPMIASAAVGDTTRYSVFNRFHMNRYGNFDQKIFVSPTQAKSQRIWLNFTLGCLSNGQCEWDYTLRIFARQRTGTLDSTLQQAPNFRINGQVKDSIRYSTDTTYTSVFNSATKQTDSLPAARWTIILYNNPQAPTLPTDTLQVWQAGFYRYQFDTTGRKTDSVWIAGNSSLLLQYTSYYSVFEVIHDVEIGRFISPYAATFPKTFAYHYLFDVTDYAPLLSDSVEIRIQYQGYSYGFTATVDLLYVEGEPARDVAHVVNVYNGGFPYGRENNSIENYLTPFTFQVPADAKGVKVKVWITGHGAESNSGCSEFCAKSYYLKLNNNLFASQLVWKNDCGKNALYPQPGTWIYDRANWCPGEKVPVYEYALNLAPGSQHTLDMDMEAFIANGDASYNIAVQLVYYKNWNYETDARVEDILAPTTQFWHNRTNPVCKNGSFILSNAANAPITSATIGYRIGNANQQTINWTGTLTAGQQTEIILPALDWPATAVNDIFTVTLLNVNGGDDGNMWNNTFSTPVARPQTLPQKFIIETRTNNRPEQNTYQLLNSDGQVIRNRQFTAANTMHRDTFEFIGGCFIFRMQDSGKNGLDFWAQPSEGQGFVRFLSPPPVRVLRSFNADFGTSIDYQFTVQFPVSAETLDLEPTANTVLLYPSPANDWVTIRSATYYLSKVTLYHMDGRQMVSYELEGTEPTFSVREIPNGLYWVHLIDINGKMVIKKLAVMH